jgi:hypothetical protein
MLPHVKRAGSALALALSITACGGSSQNGALPLAPTPTNALTACLKMTLMRPVCPPRVPMLSGHAAVLSAACFDAAGARVPLTSDRCRTAGWSLEGAPPKPAPIAHVVISASPSDWQCVWPRELRARAISDCLLNPDRTRAVSLGPVKWYGQSGSSCSLLATPREAGRWAAISSSASEHTASTTRSRSTHGRHSLRWSRPSRTWSARHCTTGRSLEGRPPSGGSPSATVIRLSRITHTQQGDIGLQTPLDPRCVRTSGTAGLHEDRTPSLHVYDDPGRGWFCFGCGRGGSIYDLASLLWRRETHGREFIELRRELEAIVQ